MIYVYYILFYFSLYGILLHISFILQILMVHRADSVPERLSNSFGVT